MSLEAKITALATVIGTDIKNLIAASGGSPGPDALKPFNDNVFKGQAFELDYFNVGGRTYNGYTNGSTAVFTEPSAGTGTYESVTPSILFTSSSETYSSSGFAGDGNIFKIGDSNYGGFILTASADFVSTPTGSVGYISMFALSGVYSTWTTEAGIGIGFDDGDTGNNVYVMVGNGTTKTKTLLTRTGAGYAASSGRKFRVSIIVQPGSNNAVFDVIDLSNNYPCLDNVSVDISSISKSQTFNVCVGSATNGQASPTVLKLFTASAVPYSSIFNYNTAAVNITGNAGTASALTSLSGLPQDGATTDQALVWNGTQWVPGTVSGGGAGEDPIILDSTDSTATGSDQVKIFRRPVAGRQMVGFVGSSGLDTPMQPHIARNKICFANANGNSTAMGVLGIAISATGTSTRADVNNSNIYTITKKLEYLANTAAANAVCGFRSTAAQFSIGGTSNLTGGFHFMCNFGFATGATVTTARCFIGLGPTGAPSDVQPSTITNIVGVGADTADTNFQILYRSTGGITKVDTGIPKVSSADRTELYRFAMFSPPGTTQSVSFEFTRISTNDTFVHTATTGLPAATTLMAPRGWRSAGGTSTIIGIALLSLYIETDY